ncbi:MAG TPA: ABC transporter ATP-binding protein [Planctomycetota bacterium]|nr:ABC transporter ATP-binding protein [Planctomycetota bacterium]
MSPPPVLEARNLARSFLQGRREVRALSGVDFRVESGEFVAVVGPSGSGKSTLLHLLGALDRPNEGEVLFEGRGIASMSDDEASRLRRTRIGFVFQFFQLFPTLSALENVEVPLLLEGTSPRRARERADAVLREVGLADRLDHRPDALAGGERQRVAIARALAPDPPVLLADEPTGNLDRSTGEKVLDLLEGLHRERGKAIVLVTHDERAAARASRLVRLLDGKVVGEERR